MAVETLAWGYGLLEGPRVDAENALWFSDIPNGGVHRRTPDGEVTVVVPGRKMIGGLVLHADGGVVVTGGSVDHISPDGSVRTLLKRDGVPHWNDCHTDALGRVIVGAVRWELMKQGAEPAPGECCRIGLDGSVEELYDGITVSNGIGFSPDGSVLYHVDSVAKAIIAHDVDAEGRCSNRRVHAAVARGVLDGMCVDASGGIWAAHFGGRRAVYFDPSGAEAGEAPVPAKQVTSVCLGGPDGRDLYIVTADNTEEPERKGTIFRTRVDVAGVPTPLARV
ncbi:MAG: SMP-30/gluconolactonase/LRE family protein [Acidimicrobiales bacterium]